MSMDKLSIANEMRCFDLKDRSFYDSLTDEERKKFSNYLMIRWGSAVQGSQELQEFYLIAANERLNKNFFAVNRHPKLQWLMATSVSPGIGQQRHQWIAPKKKSSGKTANKKISLLMDLFPTLKKQDVELLAALADDKEVAEYLSLHGE